MLISLSDVLSEQHRPVDATVTLEMEEFRIKSPFFMKPYYLQNVKQRHSRKPERFSCCGVLVAIHMKKGPMDHF